MSIASEKGCKSVIFGNRTAEINAQTLVNKKIHTAYLSKAMSYDAIILEGSSLTQTFDVREKELKKSKSSNKTEKQKRSAKNCKTPKATEIRRRIYNFWREKKRQKL